MQKLKKLAAWTVVVAMVTSLLLGTGLLTVTVSAGSGTTLSETYPEATELLTNLGVMSNAEKAWTDPITVEEINTAIDALLYAGLAQYNWPHPLFAEGDTVSGNDLIAKALVYLGWNADLRDAWTGYFHLTGGIENYDGAAALTREQAAQILNNVLKANVQYNPACIKGQDTDVGLTYAKVATDAMGRPTYQWKRGEQAMASAYKAKPVAVVPGDYTWEQLMAASGLTRDVSTAISAYWQHMHFSYTIICESIASGEWGLMYYGAGSAACYSKGWVIEVYDSYTMPTVNFGGNNFMSRGYEIVSYSDLLAQVNDAHQINMYGQPGGYGYWDGQPGVNELEAGLYIVNWSNNTTTIQNPVKAKSVNAKLTAFDTEALTVTYGETDAFISNRFYYGSDLLTADNVGKTFTFYLDSYDNVIGLGIPEIPTPTVETNYPEAVYLMMNAGLMDKSTEWNTLLTGAEANKVLQALYDGPGFVNAWSPDFAADAAVTGSDFMSDILVTIGWNYNNDGLFSAYNHLEKGLKDGYSANKSLTREQAAQIVLNALKTIPSYNNTTIKANDPGLGLTQVKTGVDSYGRPFYKWQKNGKDLTEVYRDTPVVAMQAGILWSDILSAVGNVGDINAAQSFRWNEEGGEFTRFVTKNHPDYDVFMTSDWAMEVYLDYTEGFTGYQYSIVTYEGETNVPATGDTAYLVPAAILGVIAAAAVFGMIAIHKKKYNV